MLSGIIIGYIQSYEKKRSSNEFPIVVDRERTQILQWWKKEKKISLARIETGIDTESLEMLQFDA